MHLLHHLVLEEFLVLFDGKNFLPSKIKITEFDKVKFRLKAEVFGDAAKNYDLSMHIKGITYNEMFVEKRKEKFISQVVVDV